MKTQSDDMNLLIIRYLDGSATPDEKRTLLRWLKQSESNRSDFTGTRDLWLACTADDETELEVDLALEKLRARLQEEQRKKRTFGFRYWRTVGAAAVLLLLVGIGYGLGAFHFRPDAGVPMQNQLITAKGSKGKFTLPDGTTVWLNSESKLIYPAEFAGKKREVVLDGGGYFEVVKNERKPFIVQTGKVCVEVLGTRFNVNAYSDGSEIETALLSGSVRISGEGMAGDIRLHPGELFSYTRQTGETAVKRVNAGRYADWTKERLTFDNDRLSDILVSMEGWYRMRIGATSNFYNGKVDEPYYTNQNLILMINSSRPMTRPFLPDGSGRYSYQSFPESYGGEWQNRNPVWAMNETSRNVENWIANAQAYAYVDFIKKDRMKLTWTTKGGFRYADQFLKTHYPAHPQGFYYLKESDYKPGGWSSK